MFKPRIFNRGNRSLGESGVGESPGRALSPLEKSEIMYKQGKEKLLKLKDSSFNVEYYYDKEITHKPKINENSEKIV